MNNISKQVRAKVAGLAWNDAVKSSIDRFFPLNQGNVIIKFAYALAITVVVVIVGWFLSRDKE